MEKKIIDERIPLDFEFISMLDGGSLNTIIQRCKALGLDWGLESKVSVESFEEYGSIETTAYLHIRRIETDEELAKRRKKSASGKIAAKTRSERLKKAKDQKDLREFIRLKAKYNVE